MKKWITLIMFLWFIIPVLPISAQEAKKTVVKTETAKKRVLKPQSKKNQATALSQSDAQVTEQRKKEIEAKEQSVDKNKKVKRFDTDKDLPQTISKRNIP